MNQNEPSNDEKRMSVHEGLSVSISYNDELLGGDLKDDVTKLLKQSIFVVFYFLNALVLVLLKMGLRIQRIDLFLFSWRQQTIAMMFPSISMCY